MKRLTHLGTLGGFAEGPPDDLVADRVWRSVPPAAGKQPHGRLAGQATIMLSQFLKQMRAEHDVSILAAFAVLNMEDHARGVDIGDLQCGQLGTTHACSVESHQNGAVDRSVRRLDEPAHLIRTPNHGQMNSLLRVRHFVSAPGSLQGFDEEEAERSDGLVDRVVGELSVAEQVGRVLANFVGPKLVWWTVEIARKLLDDP